MTYNVMLALYYYLVVCGEWPENRVARSAEPMMHVTAIAAGIGTASYALVTDLYNPDYWGICWISRCPYFCLNTYDPWESVGKEDGCTGRPGEDAMWYRWILFYWPIWAAMGLVTMAMMLIYNRIRVMGKSNRIKRYQIRQFVKQASSYAVVFLITWALISVARILSYFWDVYNSILDIVSIGFCNFQDDQDLRVSTTPPRRTTALSPTSMRETAGTGGGNDDDGGSSESERDALMPMLLGYGYALGLAISRSMSPAETPSSDRGGGGNNDNNDNIDDDDKNRFLRIEVLKTFEEEDEIDNERYTEKAPPIVKAEEVEELD
eukprot:CAMPEP_0116861666 /NCGR_PEP_ID=MMETSP0418-20121206/23164_1 /TAXON_ID=1158023 /ORGANISM="Astrosyne radiata, Strain 13vi08-1A" /LENGTH=320 /DNA_ID=CAMNT_0004496343 /DNA_START=20 /DNA_END=982 /DNA_ORIENTATION=+